jgi:hypothetical protein
MDFAKPAIRFPCHYLTIRSDDRHYGVRFETDQGKITMFYAGTYEAIQYVEGSGITGTSRQRSSSCAFPPAKACSPYTSSPK